MKFTLEINSDNAAFADDPAGEIARILRAVAQTVERGREEGPAVDVNGNRVGVWRIEGEE